MHRVRHRSHIARVVAADRPVDLPLAVAVAGKKYSDRVDVGSKIAAAEDVGEFAAVEAAIDAAAAVVVVVNDVAPVAVVVDRAHIVVVVTCACLPLVVSSPHNLALSHSHLRINSPRGQVGS